MTLRTLPALLTADQAPSQGLLARKDAELEERGQLLLKSKAALEHLQRERDELRGEAQQVRAEQNPSHRAISVLQ